MKIWHRKFSWILNSIIVVTITLGFLYFKNSPSKAIAQQPPPYRPYAWDWVGSGFKLNQIQLYPPSVAGRDRNGITHFIYHPQSFGGLYYTHNNSPTGIQGWSDPIIITTETHIGLSQHYIPFDASGVPHIAWTKNCCVNFSTLESTLSTLGDVWYSKKENGTWIPAVRISNAASQAVMFTTDSQACRGENPPHGREWWAIPRIRGVRVAVEQDGAPRFIWMRQWEVGPKVYDRITHELCNPQPNVPLPPNFQTQFFTKYGLGGPESAFSSEFTPSAFIVMDNMDTAHVLFSKSGTDTLYYASAARGGGWSTPEATPISAYGDLDFKVDETNTIHWLILTTSGYKYYRLSNNIWQGPETIPFNPRMSRIAVNRDGQPYILGWLSADAVCNDTSRVYKVFKRVNNQWFVYPYFKHQCVPSEPDGIKGFYVTEDDKLVVPTLWGGDADGIFIDVKSSSLLEGSGGPNKSLSISSVSSLNVANGNTLVQIPVTSTVGLGPQSTVSLTYNTLAQISFQPYTQRNFANWGFTPFKRIFQTEKFYQGTDIDRRPIFEDIVWLSLDNGKTIKLMKNEANSDYESTPSESVYLRLTKNPDETWLLEEADGTTHGFLRSGQIDWTKDSSGNMLDYQYEDNSLTPNVTEENLVRMVDAKGRTTTFIYDAENLLRTIRDPENKEHTLDYYDHEYSPGQGGAEQRLLKSVTNPLNEKWEFTYHHNTNDQQACPSKRAYLKTMKDPKGNITTFCYEIGGRLKKTINADNKEMTFRYENLAP